MLQLHKLRNEVLIRPPQISQILTRKYHPLATNIGNNSTNLEANQINFQTSNKTTLWSLKRKPLSKEFRRWFAEDKSDVPAKSLIRIGQGVHALDNEFPTPSTVLVIPIKRPVLPLTFFPLEFSDFEYIEQLRAQLRRNPLVGIFVSKEGNKSITNLSQVESVGVLCFGAHYFPNSQYFHFNSLKRIKIKGNADPKNPLLANIEEIKDEPYKEDKEFKAILRELETTVDALIKQQEKQGSPLYFSQPYALSSKLSPSRFADSTAGKCINASREELLEILIETNVKQKLSKTLNVVKKEMEIFEIRNTISKQIEENIQKSHRKFLLTEQLKMIKKELGLEKDEKNTLIAKFNKRLENLKIPEQAMNVFQDEISKFSVLEPASSEFNMTRTYLDWLTSIPWGVMSTESYDVKKASKILDEDHYGLKDVKERLLEFISVGKLKKGIQGKILCFVGPPGVGKTSIGKSIARALNREFFRFSVGGLGDVSEIKGHRRTYVGAMPGKIIQCLKQVKTQNPVIMIDEIDKLSRGYQGDPAAALLEVLDPSQNSEFVDHYLDVNVDLSKVLFVCTANVKDTIPAPLLDRMEVIQLSGYILEEKMAIAKKYLIPTIRSDSGLQAKNVTLTDTALSSLIRDYCREAGVRNLQKHIEKIFRKIAHKIVTSNRLSISIGETNLSEFVGKPVFNTDRIYDVTPPGVVMGLAWTAMGGATLYVESVSDKGMKADLRTTGQMGDVMKESTNIAYTYAKSFIDEIDHGNRFFEMFGIHMHLPEGATPKDGPSAGVTMVTSLISLARNQPIVNNVAMTGELTLTGKVLPIGGVKEKTIAAKRSGVKIIIFPKDNKKDWEDLPEHVRKGLHVFFAENYKDTYNVAFGIVKPKTKKTLTTKANEKTTKAKEKKTKTKEKKTKTTKTEETPEQEENLAQ